MHDPNLTVEAPPDIPRDKRTLAWQEIADRAIAQHPKWVVIEDVSAKTTTRIRTGQMRAFPNPDQWEVTTRNNTRNNQCTLYIKYVGI